MTGPLRAAGIAALLGCSLPAAEAALARGRLPADATEAQLLALLPPGRADEIRAGYTLEQTMDYPGRAISVNHCYTGTHQLKKEAKRWRDQLEQAIFLLAIGAGLSGLPVKPRVLVRLDCRYANAANGTDPDNLCKLTYDAVKAGLGVDDAEFQPVTGTVEYGAVFPTIAVTVTCWVDYARVGEEPKLPVAIRRMLARERAVGKKGAAPKPGRLPTTREEHAERSRDEAPGVPSVARRGGRRVGSA